MTRSEFATDSPLEGDGFEPSVPLPATAPAINFPEEGIRSPRSESTCDLAMARTQSRASPGRWRGCAPRQSGCGRAPKSRSPRLAPRRRPGRKADVTSWMSQGTLQPAHALLAAIAGSVSRSRTSCSASLIFALISSCGNIWRAHRVWNERVSRKGA
jgi:hypothetical protein